MSIHSIHAAFIVLIHSSDPPSHSVGLNSLMLADAGTCSYCMVGDDGVDVCASGLDVRVIVIEPNGVCWATSLTTSARVARTRPMTVPMQEERLITGYISGSLMNPLKPQVFESPLNFSPKCAFHTIFFHIDFLPYIKVHIHPTHTDACLKTRAWHIAPLPTDHSVGRSWSPAGIWLVCTLVVLPLVRCRPVVEEGELVGS